MKRPNYLCALCVLVTFSSSNSAALAAADPPSALERAEVARDTTTREVSDYIRARVPPLQVPETAHAWRDYARNLRRQFRNEIVFQGVPDVWRADDLEVVWTDTIDQGGYAIRKLRYEALPGMWIPALLYEPAGDAANLPAVLNVNGHVGAPGKASEYEQIRCINLAKRGMLSLHPEWFACGELMTPENTHTNIAYLDILGVRGVSVFYLALERALEILVTHPRTDRGRIAMTGLSGGGWQTAFFSALDERVKLIVPVAGHASLRSRLEALPDLGDLEQAPADMLTVADYAHLTALFAPRPSLLIYNDKDQCCFLPERTLAIVYDEVMPVYRVLGAERSFDFHINSDPGTHNYELDNRRQFYRFISAHFLPHDARFEDEIRCEDEVLPFEDLVVGVPENHATIVSLAEAQLAAITRPPVPDPADLDFAAWQARHRATLREIAKPVAMEFATENEEKMTESTLIQANYVLQSADWTIAAAYLAPVSGSGGRVTVVIADAGMLEQADAIDQLLEDDQRVLAFDPLFMGRNVPHDTHNHTLAMAVNATGRPPSGSRPGRSPPCAGGPAPRLTPKRSLSAARALMPRSPRWSRPAPPPAPSTPSRSLTHPRASHNSSPTARRMPNSRRSSATGC